MDRLERAFVSANQALVALLLALLFVIVFINVVGRYGFNSSFAWVEEGARHLMILGTFAGAGLALREGRLVAINIMPDLLPVRARSALRWVMVVVMGVFMATLLWLGIQFVQFGWDKETMSTGMSRGIPYLSIPIGCALFVVHLVLFARRYVAEDFEYDEGPVDDEDGPRGAV